MKRIAVISLVLSVFLTITGWDGCNAEARGHRGGGHVKASTSHVKAPSYHPRAQSSHPRAKSSHVKRSAKARDDFKRQTGYPHGRPGYVIDHVIPLACGGADAPSNMAWQSAADAKAKDKWERKGCR